MEMMLYHVSVYGRHPDDVTLKDKMFQPKMELVPHDEDDEIFYA